MRRGAPGVTDHLAVDVQAVGRAIDLATFHQNPRTGEQPTEKIRGDSFVVGDHGHSIEDYDRAAAGELDEDRPRILNADDSRHRRRR